MPLTILVPLIIVGITTVLLCVRLYGGVKARQPLTAASVKQRFAEDFPSAKITSINIDDETQSAWLTLEDENQIGILQHFGNGTLVRCITSADIKSIDRTENGAVLHLNDFAMKTVILSGKPNDLHRALEPLESEPT